MRSSDLFLLVGGVIALILAVVGYRRGCFKSGAAFQGCLHLPGLPPAGGAPGGGPTPSYVPGRISPQAFDISAGQDVGKTTSGTAIPSGPCQCVGGIMQGATCQTKGEFCSPASFAGISGSSIKKYWYLIAIAVVVVGYLWYKKKI